jgi:hypothetical protein
MAHLQRTKPNPLRNPSNPIEADLRLAVLQKDIYMKASMFKTRNTSS